MADRTGPEQTMRGRVVAVDDDDSATVEPRAETRSESASSALRRAVEAGVSHGVASAVSALSNAAKTSHPRLAHALKMIALTLAIGGAGTAGWALADDPECDPSVMQYVLHVAKRGGELSDYMREHGRADEADLVKAMVDPNQLPDDLRLCLLLEQRQSAKGAQ